MSKGAKRKIAQEMSIDLDLPLSKSINAVNSFIDNLALLLQKEGKAEIRGLGTFTVSTHTTHNTCNPRTGKEVEARTYKRVSYKQGSKLKRTVNE